MLEISVRNHITNTETRQRAKVRMSYCDPRSTKHIIYWISRLHKRNIGRSHLRWLDDVKFRVCGSWHVNSSRSF